MCGLFDLRRLELASLILADATPLCEYIVDPNEDDRSTRMVLRVWTLLRLQPDVSGRQLQVVNPRRLQVRNALRSLTEQRGIKAAPIGTRRASFVLYRYRYNAGSCLRSFT